MMKFEQEILKSQQDQVNHLNSMIDWSLDELIEKARSGVYTNTPENRKLGRVGQKYGSKKFEEDLPEKIIVNGKERSTKNSKGEYIHSTMEGIKNFWEWFGNSKAVDEKGNPLVLYHGTNIDFKVFNSITGKHFFSDNKKVAESYRDDYLFKEDSSVGIKKHEYEEFKEDVYVNPTPILEVYLKVDNPKIKDYKGENWLNTPIEKDIDKEKDSLIAKNIIDGGATKATTYIVFNSNQIKSAIGNNGNFDKNSNDITKSF